METTKKLVLVFKTEGGNTASLNIQNPKNNIKEEDILEAMQLVIENNIFAPKGELLAEAIEAKIVTTNSQEYDLA